MSDTQQQAQSPAPVVFAGFSGLNTQSARPSIEDDQCSWLDGFMPIGKGTARTMRGLGSAIFSALGTGLSIAWFDFANIGATPYGIVFMSNGQVFAVNTNTLVVSGIAPPGTITNVARQQAGISQWGSQFLIIVSNQPNGYFVWDGTTFYTPGMAVPGFTTVPTGISGTSVEVYQSRVWVSNGPTVEFSAPASLTDFSTADGGGTFQSNDSFLRVGFTQLRQTNGFLYLIADSSINYISGVSTSGSPSVTTFSNQNADPEIGTPWSATVDVFSRDIIFANAFGAHISYGGAVTKISDDLDGIYASVANFGGFVPSACKAIVYGKRIWSLLLPVIDAITGQQVNKLFCWNSKKWWSTQQDVPLIYVQHQEINSVITAYGSDGTKIYPLFTTKSSAFTKTIQSKLYANPGGWSAGKSADRLWGVAQYFSNVSTTLNVAIDNETQSATSAVALSPNNAIWTNAGGAQANWTTAGALAAGWLTTGSFTAGIVVFPPTAVAQNGVLLGITASTNCPDMAVLGLSYSPQIEQYRG